MIDDGAAALVLDNGSGFIKCGFGGASHPTCVVPTTTARPPPDPCAALDAVGGGTTEGSTLTASYCRPSPEPHNYPITNGIVTDWQGAQTLWEEVFFTRMGLRVRGEQAEQDTPLPRDHRRSPSGLDIMERALLLTEPPIIGPSHRTRLLETMLEDYGFAKVQPRPQTALAVFSAGLVSGVAVECGECRTMCTPVYDGYPLPAASRWVDVGGRTVTDLLARLLHRRGVGHRHSGESAWGGGVDGRGSIDLLDYATARRVKEQLCYTAVDLALERRLAAETTAGKAHFRLPDGTRCTIGEERFTAPEALFQPALVGVDSPGLARQLWESIQAADVDIRTSLCGSVVLSGGSSMSPGLPTRLQREGTALLMERHRQGDRPGTVPRHRPALSIVDVPRRRYLVFLGGAALAQQTATTPEAWITRAEWEEGGEAALRARFGVAGA